MFKNRVDRTARIGTTRPGGFDPEFEAYLVLEALASGVKLRLAVEEEGSTLTGFALSMRGRPEAIAAYLTAVVARIDSDVKKADLHVSF